MEDKRTLGVFLDKYHHKGIYLLHRMTRKGYFNLKTFDHPMIADLVGSEICTIVTEESATLVCLPSGGVFVNGTQEVLAPTYDSVLGLMTDVLLSFEEDMVLENKSLGRIS